MAPFTQSLKISGERPSVSQQVVRKRNRLCVLEVSATWHGHGEVFLGAIGEHLNQLKHQAFEVVGFIKKIGANQRGDLVVTGTTGSNFSSELSAGNFDQSALES
jgi:hypothetical protein